MGYFGDSPEEIIIFSKYMVVKYTVVYQGKVYEDTCYHIINKTDIDGTCIDPDYEIEASIKHDSDGELISWEFVEYKE